MRSEGFQDSSPKRRILKTPTGGENEMERLSQLLNHDSLEENSDSGNMVGYEDDPMIRSVSAYEADGGVDSLELPQVIEGSCHEGVTNSGDVSTEREKLSELVETLSFLRAREERTCSYIKQLNGSSRQLQMEERDLIARLNAMNEERSNVNTQINRAESILCSISGTREEKERAVSNSCSRIITLHEERVKMLEEVAEELRREIESLVEGRRRDHEAAVLRLEAEKDNQEVERKRYSRELEATMLNLQKERGKHICYMCMSRSRNALVMPCMHFLYCSECLRAHQERNNECPCPTCRHPMTGFFQCRLNVD